MRSLRRSLNSNNSQSSPPLPTQPHPAGLSRPTAKIQPPQKVIRALTTFRSQNPQELSYSQGDFWYVTGEREAWYEALNPLTGSRGLVPKNQFEEFTKGGRASGSGPTAAAAAGQRVSNGDRSATPVNRIGSNTSLASGSNRMQSPSSATSSATASKPKAAPLYAIVQYDFEAERPDELNAVAGEPIVVIAQSNHEWFVAKPIGRLGGPGLIPVSFVEIRDPVTGKALDVMPKDIPQVEEWKKATAEYKASSIPLGRFDFDPSQSAGVANSPYAPQSQAAASPPPMKTSSSMASLGAASTGSAGRTSQHVQQRASSSSKAPQSNERVLGPGSLLAASVVSFHFEDQYWFRVHATYLPDNPSQPALSLALFRLYEDFYEFQIALLAAFPREAGRSTSPAPGSSSPPPRILPFMPGPLEEVNDEITEARREDLHAYLNDLLDLRDIDAGYVLRHELVREFFSVRAGDYQTELDRKDVEDGIEERLADLSVAPTSSTPYTHERSQSVVSRSSARQSAGGERSSPQPWGQNGSASSSSRGASPLPPIDTSRRPSSPYTPAGTGHTSAGPQTGVSASSWGSNHPYASQASTPAPQSQAQPPFIKIKIFDPTTDDLIAIRAPPKVTYSQLLDKVRDRLGHEVRSLRYRISGGSGAPGTSGGMYRDIENDRELEEWLAKEDKLVLYAERA